MTVYADGGLDGLVPQVPLNNGQRHARLDHPGRACMTQIVHTRRLRQPSPYGTVTTGFPAAVEKLLCANRIASAISEQVVRCGEVDNLEGCGRKADRPDRFLRLGRADLGPVVTGIFPRLIDSTRLGVGIDIGSGQCGGFREAHAGGHQPGGQVLPAFPLDVITQQPKFSWREEYRLLDAGMRQAPALARVRSNHPGPYRRIEGARQKAMLVRDGLSAAAQLLHPPSRSWSQ